MRIKILLPDTLQLIERDETPEEASERELQAWLKIAKAYVDDGLQNAKDVAKTYADSTFAKQTDAQAIYNAFVTLKARYDKLETWATTKGYTP